MPDIINLIEIITSVLLIILIYQIHWGLRDLRRQQEKQTKILFAIAQKHGVSDSELEAIDRMHDKLMWWIRY